MPPKRTINLAVPEPLLDQFNEVCKVYGHGKQKGVVLSAAMLMFLKADPRAQGRCVREVMEADVSQAVGALLARARLEQGLAVAAADATLRAAGGSDTTGNDRPAASSPPPAKAASKRRPAKRAIKKLPKRRDRR